jgi:hypothetical protein
MAKRKRKFPDCDCEDIAWRSRPQKTDYGYRYVGKCECGRWYQFLKSIKSQEQINL